MMAYYAVWTRSHALLYYFLFFLFVICFGYFAQTAIGISYIDGSDFPAQLSFSIAIIFVVHVVGVFLGAKLFSKPFYRVQAGSVLDNLRIEQLVFVTIAVLFLVGTSLIVIGSDMFFGERISREFASNLSGYEMFLFQVSKSVPYIALGIFLQTAVYYRNSVVFWAGVAGLVVAALVISNPINTARFIMLTSFSILGVFWFSMYGLSRQLFLALFAFPFVAIVLLPLTSQVRHGLAGADISAALQMLSTLEFSSMQMLADGIESKDSLTHSNYTISGLLILVPRLLWPGKADSLGIEIAEAGGYVFSNSAVPSFFSAYADIGIVGLFVFSVVTGLVLKWAQIRDHMDWRQRGDFYKIAVFSLIPIFARGDLSTCMISFYAIATSYEICRFASRLVVRRLPTRPR
jgi:hypothetical protein